MSDDLLEVMYGSTQPESETVKEAMYGVEPKTPLTEFVRGRGARRKPVPEDFDISQIYGGEAVRRQREPNPEVIDRVEGVNMTTTRTRRHITLNVGPDRVTLPSPQMVYDLELQVKRLERELKTMIGFVRTAMLDNSKLKSELAQVQKELANKVSYPR